MVISRQRFVRTVGKRELGTGDGTHAEVLRCVRELERAVDPVVIRDRQCRIAELRRADRQLLRQRGAVQKRIRRVRVQLDVRHRGRSLPSGPGGRRALRAAAFKREALFLASSMWKLGLELDRHTRP